MEKTRNYDMFKFRTDNRAQIEQKHVDRIASSIKIKNLLEFRPIIVNEDMEIIDGQNRLLAAKQLGVDIYYQIQKECKPQDIILMNIASAWKTADYLNFYAKNGYPEYQKLAEFIKKNNISLQVALIILVGQARNSLFDFRDGKFKMDEKFIDSNLDVCKRICDYIKKMNGSFKSSYTDSGKFWKALVKVTKSAHFDETRFFSSLEKHITKFGPRVSEKDYIELFLMVFNYRHNQKIQIDEVL